jgi:hypothetical protein
VISAIVGNVFVYDFVACFNTKLVKKKPTFEVREDFPKENQPAMNFTRCCHT